jgi:hypothetical protein
MRYFWCVVFIMIFLTGCNNTTNASMYHTIHSPKGIIVDVPWWLIDSTDLIEEAINEIDMNVPEGWRVRIEVPVFATEYSNTGLARGMVDFDRRLIHVGWRHSPYEDRPLLPALVHEVQHIYNGDFH